MSSPVSVDCLSDNKLLSDCCCWSNDFHIVFRMRLFILRIIPLSHHAVQPAHCWKRLPRHSMVSINSNNNLLMRRIRSLDPAGVGCMWMGTLEHYISPRLVIKIHRWWKVGWLQHSLSTTWQLLCEGHRDHKVWSLFRFVCQVTVIVHYCAWTCGNMRTTCSIRIYDHW